MTETSSVLETSRPPIKGWRFALFVGVFLIIYVAGFLVGGEVRQLMTASLNALPFAVLAILAYFGRLFPIWGRIAATGWMLLLVGGVGLVAFGLGAIAVTNISLAQPAQPAPLDAASTQKLVLLIAGIGFAVVAGALCWIPMLRRSLSRVIPLDPQSFVHAVALSTIVATALICFVPLLVGGEPPLLVLVEQVAGTGQSLTGDRGDSGLLRDTIYGLVWTIPATIFAVGYGTQRRLRDALQRLGLVRPTWQQVAVGVGAALLLVALVQGIGMATTWLWNTAGWPQTNTEAFSELLAFAMNPLGALVIGITAGLGEELAIRGVLQPRLGILLSNLFFTSLHAFQYNWDALLVVFLVGAACGLVRKRTNTTTSAIVHGVYNFTLVMLALFVPGMR